MAGRDDWHPNELRACKGKHKYDTRIDALIAPRKEPDIDLTAYRCKVCRYYHLTHKVKK